MRWQILSGLRCVWICREGFHPVHVALVCSGFVLVHTVVIRKLLEHAGETYSGARPGEGIEKAITTTTVLIMQPRRGGTLAGPYVTPRAGLVGAR